MLFLRVGCIAMGGTPWELEDNFQRLEAYVHEATRRKAQVVIAPEAVLDGYVCGADCDVTREHMLEVGQTVPDGFYLQRACELSKKLNIYLIFGFLERVASSGGDELFNSCALFGPQGDILAKYSKVHPTNESFITPGKELRPFDTPIGRLGFLICSDRTIVENFSNLGVQQVETIFLPMDGSGGPSNTRTMSQRARDNYCSIVIANTWSSVIIDPTGEVTLEKYETECVSVGRLYVYDTPKGQKRNRFMERRPDLYEPLTKTYEEEVNFDLNGKPTPLEEKKRAEWREKLRNYR